MKHFFVSHLTHTHIMNKQRHIADIHHFFSLIRICRASVSLLLAVGGSGGQGGLARLGGGGDSGQGTVVLELKGNGEKRFNDFIRTSVPISFKVTFTIIQENEASSLRYYVLNREII